MRFLPRPYQTMAIDKMVDKPFCLLALTMGAGKTVIALKALQTLFVRKQIKRVLIVAPLRVVELVWAQEALKWDCLGQGIGPTIQRVLGSPKARERALNSMANIDVINRECFSWLVDHFRERSEEDWPYDCVVIDENRGFKNRASKSWKSLKSIRISIQASFPVFKILARDSVIRFPSAEPGPFQLHTPQ